MTTQSYGQNAASEDASSELEDSLKRRQRIEADYHARASQPGYARDLHERFLEYSKETPLGIGDLVTWKEGMRVRHYPLPGIPAVLVRFLSPEERVILSQALPAGRLAEVDDVVLGILDGNDTFRTLPFPSRRFEAFSPEDEEQP